MKISSLFPILLIITQLEKVSLHSNPKECSNNSSIVLLYISHASSVMLKFLQARLQEHMNQEFPDVQARFRKGRGTRDQISNIHWIIEKPREFQKTSTSASLTTLAVWITTDCGKFLRSWEHQKPYLPPEKCVCGSRSSG